MFFKDLYKQYYKNSFLLSTLKALKAFKSDVMIYCSMLNHDSKNYFTPTIKKIKKKIKIEAKK